MFTTDRLTLREWRTTDITHFQRIWNDKRCQHVLTNTYHVPIDVDKAKEFIGMIFRALGTILALAITLKPPSPVSGETVGSSEVPAGGSGEEPFVGWVTIQSANPKNRDGTLGIAVHPDYWNKKDMGQKP
jgi:RimJ/RimL family protein N-acetyltransferase